MSHHRHRNFKGVVIPSAARWEMHSCRSCPNIHLVLFTDDGEPFAEAVLGDRSYQLFCTEGAKLLADLKRDNLRRQL